MSEEYDVVVVGAGVIGPVIATQFGRQGRSVLVVERDFSEPDRIVGELLQPGGVESLRKLGMTEALEGIDAIRVEGYKIIYNGRHVSIPYPLIENDKQEKGQRQEGRSFHHGKFIGKLRQIAKGTPGVEFYEATVTSTISDPETGHVLGVKTRTKDGKEKEFYAKLTVMCDGISSKFRKSYTTSTPAVRSHFVALELKDPILPARHFGHVIIGNKHQPILIYQIGTHETRILCDIKGPMPSVATGEMKEHLLKNVVPFVPEETQPSLIDALETQRIRSMPNQYLPATVNKTPGIVLIGDAMNMRHPLTGGGMTVAFNDAYWLTQLLSPQNVPDLAQTELVLKQLKRFFGRRKGLGSVVNILAMALYSLFAADDYNLEILQMGCFRYFELGGNCVNTPVKLLSGLLPRPAVLFYHFFMVAICAVYWNMVGHGIAGFPGGLVRAILVLITACNVFLPILMTELKWW